LCRQYRPFGCAIAGVQAAVVTRIAFAKLPLTLGIGHGWWMDQHALAIIGAEMGRAESDCSKSANDIRRLDKIRPKQFENGPMLRVA
jgi:hypothetical protein